jgi:hypothetical protein
LSTRRSDVRTRKRKPSILEKADNQIQKLEVSMDKCTQLLLFLQALFDDPAVAQKAAMIVGGITKARSPRLSDIARERFCRLLIKLHETERKGVDQMD